MTTFGHDQYVRETLRELREDAALLRMALLGGQSSMDGLTFSCLLRLSDYLRQHVDDVWVLCGKKPSLPFQ